MSLKEAFFKLQQVRTYARPSLSFFSQLIEYELECKGINSVQMVREPMSSDMDLKQSSAEKVNNKKKKRFSQEQYILVPDFYEQNFPDLLKMEIADAKSKGNNPFVSNISALQVHSERNNNHQVSTFINRLRNRNNSKVKMLTGVDKLPMSSDQSQQPYKVYLNSELKPFVVENISYKNFLAELEMVRNNLQSNPIIDSSALNSFQ